MSPDRYTRPDPSDPIQALAACYAAFVLTQTDHPGVEAGIEPDLVWTITGIPIAGFNRVMGARLAADTADDRIVDVLDRYRERRSSISWWIDPAAEPVDLAARLVRHGLAAEGEPTPAMALELADLPGTPAVAGLAITDVDNPDALRVACAVALDGFGGPAELADELVARLSLSGLGPDRPLRMVVARLDDRPVATAAVLLAGDAAAVYNVATVADARGRGIGAAVTTAVCRQAADRGARTAVLESSAMGQSVYRRLGFRDVGAFRILHRSSWD
jgi:ribosomal protein S18 acetylase RimI-like enzyme